MIYSFIAIFVNLVIEIIQATGYWGIGVMMAIESLNVPIPSEVIMPFAGFLVHQGILSFWLVVFVGAIGNLVGSVCSYYVGFYGGRVFLLRWGKFIFFSLEDLEKGEKWFLRYGSQIAFFSRLLPVVRTFVSFPAGVARMPIGIFSLYTFCGSFLWSLFLTYAGYTAGEHWDFLSPLFHKLDWLFLLVLAMLLIWWIRKHTKKTPK